MLYMSHSVSSGPVRAGHAERSFAGIAGIELAAEHQRPSAVEREAAKSAASEWLPATAAVSPAVEEAITTRVRAALERGAVAVSVHVDQKRAVAAFLWQIAQRSTGQKR